MPITERTIFAVAWWVGVGALLGLVVTGVWLSVAYQPSPAAAWDDLGRGETSPSATLTWIHVAAGWILAGVGVVASLVGLFDRFRHPISRILMGLTLPAIWLSFLLGRMLPWDQIALRAVTVGSDLSGINVAEIVGDEFRFIIVNGREIDPDRFLAVFAAHVVVAVFLLVAWVAAGTSALRVRSVHADRHRVRRRRVRRRIEPAGVR